MPLYQEWSPDTHSLAAIWHIEEDEAFFQQAISVTTNIRHSRKRAEHLCGRYLLRHLKADFPLHHIAADEHDKPRLPTNQYFFSISHSYPYVAAVIADTEECGIDIQVWKPRMEEIAYMFLSEQEMLLCRDDAKLLTLAWSVKEAAYKWNGRRGADFINDLPIQTLLEDTNFYPPHAPRPFYVEMKCFNNKINPKALIHKDFALAYLIQHSIRNDTLFPEKCG